MPIVQTPQGFNWKAIIKAADVAALGAGTTGTIAIFPRSGTFPAGFKARQAAILLITAFDASDAAINSLLAEVGDGNSTARLVAQTELAVDGTEVLNKGDAQTTAPFVYDVADTIDVKFTVAGGASPTLAEINVGEVEIYLAVDNLRLNVNTVR